MGYGLLLALYSDDKAAFDGLYKFVKAHATAVGGLMHWKVDKFFCVSKFLSHVYNKEPDIMYPVCLFIA